MTYGLRGRIRIVWASARLVDLGVGVLASGTITDLGHLAAFAIGLALWPLTLKPRRDGRSLEPAWSSVSVAKPD